MASSRYYALGVFGKRLARRAANQNAETRGTESIAQLITSKISDALVNKTGVQVVVFVGKTGGGVDVISGSHRNTCVEQSARQAASAAEKINGCDALEDRFIPYSMVGMISRIYNLSKALSKVFIPALRFDDGEEVGAVGGEAE